MKKHKRDSKQQILELSAALEIAKFQRDAYRDQVEKLEHRLDEADQRAERAEARLHEVTLKLSNLAMQAATAPALSNASEILIDGKSILRLNNPVHRAPHGPKTSPAQSAPTHVKNTD